MKFDLQLLFEELFSGLRKKNGFIRIPCYFDVFLTVMVIC
jgi:hypothetical protein